jgi:hypothetical protein
VCPCSVSHVVRMYPPHLFVIKTCMCLFVCYVFVECLPAEVDSAFFRNPAVATLMDAICADSGSFS